MNTKPNAIQVRMPDGSLSTELIDSFVNSRTAMIEATRRVPLHRTTLVPVHTTDDDYADIKGKVYLKHSARCRLASAAGVREVGPPVTETYERDGKTYYRVSVGLTRPPIIMEPVWGQAEGCEADQKPHEREHFTAKLQTRAHARALKKILGEAFLYDRKELAEKNGLFLVAALTEDEDNEDVRRILLQNMSRSNAQLYGSAPKPPATPTPPQADGVIDDDVFDEADQFEDAEFDDIDDAFGEGVATPEAAPSAGSTVAAPDLPNWCKAYKRDEFGYPDWTSLDVRQVEALFKAELRSIKYDVANDPAGIIPLGKAKQWADASDRLLKWQMGGGTNA